MAENCHAQGQPAESDKLLGRSLAIKKMLGRMGVTTAAPEINERATQYLTQGKYHEAKATWRGLLELYERALGPEHPEVAQCLNNLAASYKAQEKHAEAEFF